MFSYKMFARLLFIFIVSLCCFLGSANAQVILPPEASNGIYPWVVGFSIPPYNINVLRTVPDPYGDTWPNGTPQLLQNVPFEDYVARVIMGELGSQPYISGWPYNASQWADQAIRAASTAFRTYGSYHARQFSSNGFLAIRADETNQVYRPYYQGMSQKVKDRFISINQTMAGLYVAYNYRGDERYKGVLIDALHKQDTDNPSISGWNGQGVTGYGYLPSVSNPYLSSSYSALGLPQLPLQAWSMVQAGSNGTNNATWWQMLAHYYPGSHIMNSPTSNPIWDVKYYTQKDNSGCVTSSLHSQTSARWINFDWSTGSIGIINQTGRPTPQQPSNVPADNMCVVFDTLDTFPGNSWYTFFIVADDGFKLLIDGNIVLDRWLTQSPTIYAVNVPLTNGNHQVTLKYFEGTGGAVARLFWRRFNGFIGNYYDTIISKSVDPSNSEIIMQRADPTIGFEWTSTSPLDTREAAPFPRIYEDSFSAIWQTYITIPPGSCRNLNFTAITDDGMYVTLTTSSQEVLLDEWHDQGPTTYNFSRNNLCPGIYLLKIRYYESVGSATVRFYWN